MEPSSDGGSGAAGPQFRTGPLIASAALIGAGTLMAMAGLIVGASHLVHATRRWVNDMDVPPGELARLKWAQARAAMAAGASAWQGGVPATPAGDS